jgi:hypothetical protein
MASPRKIASVAFTGGAAMAAIGMAAQPAFATGGKWVPNPGPGAYTAHNVGNTTLSVSTSLGVQTLTCPTAAAAGSLKSNTAASGFVPIGTVSGGKTTFGTTASPCTLGPIHFTAVLNKTINLSAKGTVSKPITGRVDGSISATLTGVGNSCVAHVTGTSVPGSWHNSSGGAGVSHTLDINPSHLKTLKVKDATNCPIIKAGNPAGFFARYALDSPRSNQLITDP